MRVLLGILIPLIALPPLAAGQGLRKVPQRFAYVQPIGLALGVGYAGFEFAVARSSSVEIGGVGVYSKEDGIAIYGGGPGVAVRRYFGEGEVAGLVVGGRIDGVWLRADNTGADRRFLAVGFGAKESAAYLGLGALIGYRWVSTSGLVVEPVLSYEYFAGPRPLVPGSRGLQDDLGISLGIGLGWAW